MHTRHGEAGIRLLSHLMPVYLLLVKYQVSSFKQSLTEDLLILLEGLFVSYDMILSRIQSILQVHLVVESIGYLGCLIV